MGLGEQQRIAIQLGRVEKHTHQLHRARGPDAPVGIQISGSAYLGCVAVESRIDPGVREPVVPSSAIDVKNESMSPGNPGDTERGLWTGLHSLTRCRIEMKWLNYLSIPISLFTASNVPIRRPALLSG